MGVGYIWYAGQTVVRQIEKVRYKEEVRLHANNVQVLQKFLKGQQNKMGKSMHFY